jgi:hypothetical protein
MVVAMAATTKQQQQIEAVTLTTDNPFSQHD